MGSAANWKINTVPHYLKVHYWVKKQLGKPRLCSKCGTTEAKYFDWANISGEYKYELSDWIRLCRRCHHRMDWNAQADGLCTRGLHPSTPENTYTPPRSTSQLCAACMTDRQKADYQRRKVNGPFVAKVPKKFCRQGHKMEGANVYNHPTAGVMCRPCKQEYKKQYELKRKSNVQASNQTTGE